MSKVIELPSGTIEQLPDFQKFYEEDVVDIIFHFPVGAFLKPYTIAAEIPGFLIVSGASEREMEKKMCDLETCIKAEIVVRF